MAGYTHQQLKNESVNQNRKEYNPLLSLYRYNEMSRANPFSKVPSKIQKTQQETYNIQEKTTYKQQAFILHYADKVYGSFVLQSLVGRK